jgi:serine/threonine-protein kinase
VTPERWRQIGELFEAAVRIEPAGREAWLRAACGGDDELRAEVARLLALDERADRDRFLTPPEVINPPADSTGSWPLPADRLRPGGDEPPVQAGASPVGGAGGFTPRAAIRAGVESHPSVDAGSLAQQQLRALTFIYIGIAVLMLFWKFLVVRDPDPSQSIPYALLLVTLGGIVVRLSSPIPVSASLLQALEVGMIGLFAAVFAFTQYETMLDFTLRGEPLRAQFVMNHRVLIATILILSYGIYVTANWRWAALIVGSIAILPFATLMALYLRHPRAMGWLERMESGLGATPLALLSFDAMLLLILAAGSAYGAFTISRLRRQVKEARQLGQYRLGRRLGAGGMGEVYLAEHLLLKRPCALKLIRPGAATDPQTLKRFEREVRLTATLSHPNTVEIYDYGRAEDGTYYYVMEYLDGLSLAELVERHGPLPPGRVVFLLRQVCGALGEAHAAGLIHRDIKPSNIFAARRGGLGDVAKLLDFGLVLPRARTGAAPLSGEGQILGTPLFMSPEQATGGRELDARSDIYSLGAVAYFLLTGRPPFEGDGGIEVLIAHARDLVVPPSRVRPGIPEDLERVVLRCLAKDAAERFPDAESLERALAECACVGDWDQDRGARWWRDSDRPQTRATLNEGAAGSLASDR